MIGDVGLYAKAELCSECTNVRCNESSIDIPQFGSKKIPPCKQGGIKLFLARLFFAAIRYS